MTKYDLQIDTAPKACAAHEHKIVNSECECACVLDVYAFSLLSARLKFTAYNLKHSAMRAIVIDSGMFVRLCVCVFYMACITGLGEDDFTVKSIYFFNFTSC